MIYVNFDFSLNTGDELFSDTYPIEFIANGCVLKVKGKVSTVFVYMFWAPRHGLGLSTFHSQFLIHAISVETTVNDSLKP